MSRPIDQISGYRYAPLRRSRAGAALAALALIGLIALLLWQMGLIQPPQSATSDKLVSITMRSGRSEKPQSRQKAAAKAKASTQVAATRPRAKPQVAMKPPPLATKPALSFIPMTGADMAAADISHLPKGSGAGGGAGKGGGSTYGPGDGPGGMELRNVAWYREPTDAELVTYMPKRVPPGSWATIACRMIEHYHVEDCQQLDESPPGSGLSRALRQASWQFLVRPPRENGREMIGTWVRIRMTFSRPPPKSEPPEG